MIPEHLIRLAYFCYPIDKASGNTLVTNHVEYVKRNLSDLIAVTFDPGQAFGVSNGAGPGPEIQSINDYAVMNADVIMAFLPKAESTVGVPCEIAMGIAMGKDVVVFTDNAESWVIAGWASKDNVYVTGFEMEYVDGVGEWLASRDSERGSGGGRENLPVVVEDGAGRLPSRSHEDDAGLDLYVTERTVIGAGKFVDVPCGVRVELPSWTWAMLTGRSSTLRRRGLMVNTGVIDPGYRGPLFAGVFNLTNNHVIVEEGERLAQLIIMQNVTAEFDVQQVDTLSDHPRGQNGFGSSGL